MSTQTKEQRIQDYYKQHRDFISMTNTNMYDSIYFCQHNLNMLGFDTFNIEAKISAKYVDQHEDRIELYNYLKEHGYRIRALNGYAEALKFDNEGYIETGIFIIYHLNMLVFLVKDQPYLPEHLKVMKEKYKNSNLRITEYNKPGDNLQGTIKELKIEDRSDYHEEFYPWMEEDINDWVREFMASTSNAILLIGPPGTGKTSFIKQVLLRQHGSIMASSNEDVILSNKLINEFDESDCSVLVMEDADKITGKREDGNSVMSNLLNTLSGITSDNKRKIIISTNLPSINRVDPALIRPGRCFQVLEFRKLTHDEANEAREAIDLDPVDFPESKQTLTLAEALNWDDSVETTRHQSSMGFK